MINWNQVFNLEDDWVVAFLDIVGFSNAMINNQDATMEEEGAHIDFESISKNITGKYSTEYQAKRKINFLWVSDSLFLAVKKEFTNILFEEMDEILNTFYCTHFSVRGGIALGKLFFKENIWGPALIQAVKMEENAVYPRILICKKDIEKLNLCNRYRSNLCFIPYSDYAYYDFFSSYFSDLVSKKRHISSWLSVYTQVVEDNFNACKEDRHKKKWAFLCDELTRTITSHAEQIDSNYTEQLKEYPKTPALDANGYIQKMKNVRNYINGGMIYDKT